MVPPPSRIFSSPACGGGWVGVGGRAVRRGSWRREALPQPSHKREGRRCCCLRNSSPPPLAGEAGWGLAAARPGKDRCAGRPSPSPSRRREGSDGAAAPLQFFSSPTCGRGREGIGGRAARQGSLRWKALPRPLPQAGGGRRGRRLCRYSPPLLAGEVEWGLVAVRSGKDRCAGRSSLDHSGRREGRAMGLLPSQFLSSPACGGGREGAGGRAAWQGSLRREALPTPPAGGRGGRWGRCLRNSSPPSLAGEAGRGRVAVQLGKACCAGRFSLDHSGRREGRAMGALPSQFFSPACRGGREGAGGRAAWQGPLRRDALPQSSRKREGSDGAAAFAILLLPRLRGRPGGGWRPRGPARLVAPGGPPPAPPASGRGAMEPRPLQIFSSCACGGGREGGRRPCGAARPLRRETLPRPLPQAGGGRWGRCLCNSSPPPFAGEAGRGPAAVRSGKARRVGMSSLPLPQAGGGDGAAAFAVLLLPRLRGSPGGGRRSRGAVSRIASGGPPRPFRQEGREGEGAAAFAVLLLPRLRGRPGGGWRPCGPARLVAPGGPLSTTPANGRGGWWGRCLRSSFPLPLAEEPGRGQAAVQRGKDRSAGRPSPDPSRKREGSDDAAALAIFSSLACGGGWEGVGGRVARQGRRAERPSPSPPASGRGAMAPLPSQFLSFSACEGDREKVGGRAVRKKAPRARRPSPGPSCKRERSDGVAAFAIPLLPPLAGAAGRGSPYAPARPAGGPFSSTVLPSGSRI